MAFANVILRSNPTGEYGDGDILCAINRRMIMSKHAEHLCFRRGLDRRLLELTNHGLLAMGGVGRAMLETVKEFRFNRVGKNAFTITRLADMTVTDILPGDGSLYHNPLKDKWLTMNLKIFLNRRLKVLRAPGGNGLPIFGVPGAEFWYGGKTDTTRAKVALVWDAIEAKTGKLRGTSEFRRMPGIEHGTLRNNTVIEVDDFSDAAVDKLMEPLYDPATLGDPDIRPVVVAARRHRIRWQEALGMTAEEIQRAKNPADSFDHRVIRNHGATLLRDAMRRKRYQDTEIAVPGDILD